MGDEYWVEGELRDVGVNYWGDWYVEFVEKDGRGNGVVGKGGGIIWGNVFRGLGSYFEGERGEGLV